MLGGFHLAVLGQIRQHIEQFLALGRLIAFSRQNLVDALLPIGDQSGGRGGCRRWRRDGGNGHGTHGPGSRGGRRDWRRRRRTHRNCRASRRLIGGRRWRKSFRGLVRFAAKPAQKSAGEQQSQYRHHRDEHARSNPHSSFSSAFLREPSWFDRNRFYTPLRLKCLHNLGKNSKSAKSAFRLFIIHQ